MPKNINLEKNRNYIKKLEQDNDISSELINLYKEDINWFLNNHFECPIEKGLENCEQSIPGLMDNLVFENQRFYREKKPCGHTLYIDRFENRKSKFIFADYNPFKNVGFLFKENNKNVEFFLKKYTEIKDIAEKKNINKQEFDDKHKIVKYFTENLKLNKNNGVFISGSMGIGKTTLIQSLALYASDNYNKTIAFTSVSNLINKVKESFNTYNNGETIITKLQNADILFLDDIGGEPPTEWMRDDLLFTILNYRMENDKMTYFTSNFEIDELEMLYLEKINKINKSYKNTDNIKNERFFERINVLSKEMLITGNNHRKK